ncbi:MAG TPA: FMN-binding protein [Eudoraea sp.]|nr:FMN-binding protein [Eudoraea sp.]
MKHSTKLTITALVLGFLFFGFGLPEKIRKKVDKEVEKVFETTSYAMEPILVPGNLNTKLPVEITSENFYRLSESNNILGYAFVDKAPSKTAKFDYLVIFDTDLRVIHSKVLVYREEYGGEIGSKRWLKQFLGKTGGDRVDYETNIDAISGATISVRSMTRSMDRLLQTVGILQENNIL